MLKLFLIAVLFFPNTYSFAIIIKTYKIGDITRIKLFIRHPMERDVEVFKARDYGGACSDDYQIKTYTRKKKSAYIKMIKIYRENNLFSTIVTTPNISNNPILKYNLILEKELPFSIFYITNKGESKFYSTTKIQKPSKESNKYTLSTKKIFKESNKCTLNTKKIFKEYNPNNVISSNDITITVPLMIQNRAVIPLTVKSNIKLLSFAIFSDRTQTPLIIYVKNEKASYIDFSFKFGISDNTTFDYNITVVGKDENGILHKSVIKSKLNREGDCCGCV